MRATAHAATTVCTARGWATRDRRTLNLSLSHEDTEPEQKKRRAAVLPDDKHLCDLCLRSVQDDSALVANCWALVGAGVVVCVRAWVGGWVHRWASVACMGS